MAAAAKALYAASVWTGQPAPMTAYPPEKRRSSWRAKRAGRSLREARSPAPPKMTMTKGPTRTSPGASRQAAAAAFDEPSRSRARAIRTSPGSISLVLLFEPRDLPDTPGVTAAQELRPEPGPDDPPGRLPVERPAAEDEDVGVVV